MRGEKKRETSEKEYTIKASKFGPFTGGLAKTHSTEKRE
jgi:hypothetical protein